MKFTYNVGDKLVAKEIKTIANIFNHYVPAGSVVTLLENVSNKNGYELIKIKASDGIHFATSAAYFEPYIEKENHSSEKDNVIDNLAKFIVDNLEEKDLDDFIATAATVIEKAYPGFLEKYNKNKEKCCEGENCNCSEDCNCLCENCDCGKDKKIEETFSEVEAYSGKIYCVESDYDYITEGKIYEVKKGIIEADDGWKLKFSTEARVLPTFEEFSEALRGKWVEVKEEIPFNLKKVNPYNGKIICIFATEVERFTKGNIYEVKDGILCDNSDGVYSYWNVPFENVEQINEYCNSEFAEIKE